MTIDVAADITIQHVGLSTTINSLVSHEHIEIATGSSLAITANSVVYGYLNNSGTVDVQSGSLTANGGGTSSGSYMLGTQGVVSLWDHQVFGVTPSEASDRNAFSMGRAVPSTPNQTRLSATQALYCCSLHRQ